LLAGEEALRSHAFEEAIAHFEQGLAAHGSGRDTRVHAGLLFGIGRAQVSTLADIDLQAVVDTLNSAFDIYTELGDSDSVVAVAEYPIPMAAGIHGAMRLTERALTLIPEDSHAAGKLLSLHGLWVWIEKQDHELAVSQLDRALVTANQTDNSKCGLELIWHRCISGRID